jgi:nucleoside-diphosphate kinase
MIKPDAVSDGFSGPIIQQIEEAGFKIIALKKVKLSQEEVGRFYEIHKERPFFQSLCDYMSSNDIIPMILEKENAVEDFRILIGATNPASAAEGTIRKRFAKSLEANAIHGSDSNENATIEANFFFETK